MKYHFIAIGGSVMHNLALALKSQGNTVTGSDDEIFEPSLSRLKHAGILPEDQGWDENRIDKSIDIVILGMHAKEDNPELIKAKELDLKVLSFPEFLYEHSKNKTRLVIGGSHGKTTITSMIMHVLKEKNIDFDYIVGAMIEGFDIMARLSDNSELMIFEGDEYLTSPLDRRPKFHLYKPHVALLSGVAWDHFNVFPTFENYVEQFRIFISMIQPGGSLVFYNGDKILKELSLDLPEDVSSLPYYVPRHHIKDGITYLVFENDSIPLQVFGDHNLANLEGARLVLNQIGISDEDFYESIKSFTGAARRLQKIYQADTYDVYLDFAHSPSKLEATVNAVKNQYPDRKLVACMELHTFSSLNKDFISNYAGSMNPADIAIVYYNPHTVKLKRLESIDEEYIKEAFAQDNLIIFTEASKLKEFLLSQNWNKTNLLMMSSGNFDNLDINKIAEEMNV
ncbi:UDP-N-acetylmuramate--L-alanine ligase [Bacteroidota bacterium]